MEADGSIFFLWGERPQKVVSPLKATALNPALNKKPCSTVIGIAGNIIPWMSVILATTMLVLHTKNEESFLAGGKNLSTFPIFYKTGTGQKAYPPNALQ
ncbi:MAG: hypothetical protein V1848_03695 [Candidatus Magasanikbacteria bacterium]